MVLMVTLLLLAGVVTLGVRRGVAEAPARQRLEQALRAQVQARSAELTLTRERVGALDRQVAAGRSRQRRAAERQARSAADVAALGPPGPLGRGARPRGPDHPLRAPSRRRRRRYHRS
ncbi:hypothetical protein [Candidatus Frankia nodulisporulans]|uniref:hypothetical protein n=1 Tax=Candidatus Frankia nodulisporulans TaxID=2060052 RepID=UPI0013D8984B|nr:hypothetical protein [Candidatus Frankia nodulisporulans]